MRHHVNTTFWTFAGGILSIQLSALARFETQSHINAFITCEAESVMEGGERGGLRKVATYHNPS